MEKAMNIEMLNDIINLFEERIINSGFNRDLSDCINSWGANQNNIINLRNIAEKIEKHLNDIYKSELPDLLINLFPQKNVIPFTKENHLEKLQTAINNPTSDISHFYQDVNGLLTNLNNQLQNNR
jgi:hypothetical protein